jgi:hypothetical protein
VHLRRCCVVLGRVLRALVDDEDDDDADVSEERRELRALGDRLGLDEDAFVVWDSPGASTLAGDSPSNVDDPSTRADAGSEEKSSEKSSARRDDPDTPDSGADSRGGCSGAPPVSLDALQRAVGWMLYRIAADNAVAEDGASDSDSDAGGVHDGLEVMAYRTLPKNPADDLADPADDDKDGLTNDEEECVYFTGGATPDSDGDGLEDGDEVRLHGTNPRRADSDRDGRTDAQELLAGTDPLLADTDKTVATLYGTLGPLGFARRSVFIIDRDGIIRYAHRAMAGLTYRPVDELVAALAALD